MRSVFWCSLNLIHHQKTSKPSVSSNIISSTVRSLCICVNRDNIYNIVEGLFPLANICFWCFSVPKITNCAIKHHSRRISFLPWAVFTSINIGLSLNYLQQRKNWSQQLNVNQGSSSCSNDSSAKLLKCLLWTNSTSYWECLAKQINNN